jgi:hypothetical protein
VVTLTSLDLLGFGLPPARPHWANCCAQGKNNLQAPWLGLTGFFTIAIMMTLLVFIGEAVRDAFDPRKTIRHDRPLLSVENLTIRFGTPTRRRGVSFDIAPGRRWRWSAKVRLGQVGHRALGAASSCPIHWRSSERARSSSRARTSVTVERPAELRAVRGNDISMIFPGADEFAQSGAHRRAAGWRGPDLAPRPARHGCGASARIELL